MSFEASMKAVQQDALKEKGSYIHYSQSLEPTKSLIESLPYTSNGICQALAAKWIAEHANGKSLWPWLFKPGTTVPSAPHIANLMINFTETIVRTAANIDKGRGNRSIRKRIASALSNPTTRRNNTGGEFYQDYVTDKYLALYAKLARRKIVQSGIAGSMGNQLAVGSGLSAGVNLGKALHQDKMVSRGGSYVLISIMGNGGHAMAAYVDNDIAFFDPNYGEFWFPNHAKFYNWFCKFWKTSNYYLAFDKYYLMPYAKGVG